MRARDFFRQVVAAEKELKMLNAKMRHYEDIGLSLGSAIASSSGNVNKGASRVELAACGAVDALRDVQDKQAAYLAIIAHAEKVIDQVPQERYRQILSYKYLCDWSFRSISDELKYSDQRSVYRAHGWALVEAQKILNQEEQEDG